VKTCALGLRIFHVLENKTDLNLLWAFLLATNAIQIKAKQDIPEKEWTNIAVTYMV